MPRIRPLLIDRVVAAELARDLAEQGSTVRFIGHGASMEPSICAGSLLIVEQCALADVEPGWVVMVSGPQGMIVHRAVARGDGALVLWGDALPRPDGPLSDFRVIGRVVAMEPPRVWHRVRTRLGALARRVRRVA